ADHRWRRGGRAVTPETLLTELRRAGVALYTEGEALRFRGRVPDALRPLARDQKDALMRLIYSSWWPDARPKPNVLDLRRAFGARAVDDAFLAVGCALRERNPSCEALFVVAERLGWTGPPPFTAFPERIGGPPPAWLWQAAPALAIKAATAMRDEAFSAL